MLRIVGLATLLTVTAHADTSPDCTNPKSQMEINECAAIDMEYARTELARTVELAITSWIPKKIKEQPFQEGELRELITVLAGYQNKLEEVVMIECSKPFMESFGGSLASAESSACRKERYENAQSYLERNLRQ